MIRALQVLAVLTTLASFSFGSAQAASPEQKMQQMIDSGAAYSHEQLSALFDQLAPVTAEFMIGTWRGGKFDGGSTPDPIGWFGKRFSSRDHVDPLLVHGPNQSVTVFRKLGDARLREVAFRGKLSASLIYDKQPIMDYFRKVSDETVIGWGEVKGKNEVLFFHLTRSPETDVLESGS